MTDAAIVGLMFIVLLVSLLISGSYHLRRVHYMYKALLKYQQDANKLSVEIMLNHMEMRDRSYLMYMENLVNDPDLSAEAKVLLQHQLNFFKSNV